MPHPSPRDAGASDPATPAPAAHLIPRPGVTRAEVARLAGISKSQVRRLEGSELAPIVGAGGVRFFPEEQVNAFVVSRRRTIRAHRDDGDIAAEVFEAFDSGTNPADVVKELRIDPKRVLGLHVQWLGMRQQIALSRRGRDWLKAVVPASANASNEEELLAAIEQAFVEERNTQERLAAELRAAQAAAWAGSEQMLRAIASSFDP